MQVRDFVLNAAVSIGALMACTACHSNSTELVEGSDNPAGVVVGSGKETSEVRMASGNFTGVEATWGQDVTVHVGKPLQIRVIGNDNVLEFVKTDVSSKRLKISMPCSYTNVHCRVEVDTPKLGGSSNSGSGNINIDGIDTDSFDVVSDGSGNITVSGAAKDFHALVSGSGNVDARELKCKGANVLVQGSGNLKCAPSKELNAAVSGSGNVICFGQPPKVTKAVKGSGAVVFK